MVRKEYSPVVSTPKEILQSTAEQIRQLSSVAHNALTEGDQQKYRRALETRAKLVADLPKKIESSSDGDSQLSQGELAYLGGLGRIAEETILQGDIFPLSHLLTRLGANDREPNQLELFVKKKYPEPTSQSPRR